MQRLAFGLLALAVLLVSGCTDAKARVKGRLVSNGAPMSFPPTQVAVQLSPVNAEGKPDSAKIYTAVVNEDGSFEVVASGGELPPGKYQVSLVATGKLGTQLKGFASPGSPVRRDVKPGPNELTIDIAKPDGG